jgi:eukaryotic-like serine/threonine-protein kinase
MRWMPNGRSLAFLAPGAAGSNGIFVQDFDPGHDTSASRRPVAGFDLSQTVESFAISPDGKRFVLAVHEHFDNLLEIRGLPQLQGRRPSR